MQVQRLGWAGIKIETGGICILVDAVENFAESKSFVLDTPDAAYRFSATTKADFVLVTHLHHDHYDPQLIRQCLQPGGKVVASTLFADRLRQDGFTSLVELALEETFDAGPVQFTPVFAMDGVGDKQVSWVIADGTHRILHAGDTIWHNQFWHIGEKFREFDAVFMPVNGAVMYFKLPFSPIPATLTPEQAVAAASLLHAKTLVPIHYGFHKPGLYEERPYVKQQLQEHAEKMRVGLALLQAGEALPLNFHS